MKLPKYNLIKPDDDKIVTIYQKETTKGIRPYVVGAILRNVTFNETNYRSFIDLQDKLHQNIGRERTLVAIGTHDYDTISKGSIY